MFSVSDIQPSIKAVNQNVRLCVRSCGGCGSRGTYRSEMWKRGVGAFVDKNGGEQLCL